MLNAKQLIALDGLEKLFKIAKEQGIIFMGMDDQLLAFDHNELIGAGYNDDPIKAMRGCDQGHPVYTHGCYIDSGGW